MNKIEILKSEKDGLKIKADIHRMAKEGWESISEDDIQRLKWYGLFLRNPTPGFFMLRVRIPNGFSLITRIARSMSPTFMWKHLNHFSVESLKSFLEKDGMFKAVHLETAVTEIDNIKSYLVGEYPYHGYGDPENLFKFIFSPCK